MDTLGNLIDKLCTVNLKLWHCQEEIYVIRKMTVKEFEKKYAKDLKGLHSLLNKATNLNVQRAQLMDEIDTFFAGALMKKDVKAEDLTRPQHKIY